jgi:Mce-associated membrane protein
MHIRLLSRGSATPTDLPHDIDGIETAAAPRAEITTPAPTSDENLPALDFPDEESESTRNTSNVESHRRQHSSWRRPAAFVVLPILAMIAAAAVGFLRYEQRQNAEAQTARTTSTQAARDAAVAILSYRPDTVEKDLAAAESKLTGSFRDSYNSLTKDVVIPGAKQKQVSAEASVPAAAPVSATANHAVVMVFVNQVLIVGNDAPTSTMSSVRVTLDNVDGNWLVSGFDPV